MTSPSLSPLAELPAALGLAAFEPVTERLFLPLGRLPDWFPDLPPGPCDLPALFPALEAFLTTRGDLWQGVSPAWRQRDARGAERDFEAVATTTNNRRFLILRRAENTTRVGAGPEQTKSEFLARMSHEIRTPLNAIIGMTDVLAAGSLTAEQQRCVEVARRNGLGLLHLINDILDMSKLDTGQFELETSPFDLREVLAGVTDIAEARASAKGLELRSSLTPGLPVALLGDAGRLRQILLALLDNAVRFTDMGSIAIDIGPDPGAPRPGRFRFAISDTGPGISPELAPALFEAFTQADASTTRKHGGAGLGLAISRRLAERMQGRLQAESAPGAGSTFFFTAGFGLQRTQPANLPPATLEALEARASGMKILLAEDSRDNAFLILSYLKRTASVDVAENGQIAVDLFRAGRYDLVLMDVEMPVMDGWEATRAIRDFERQSAAPPTPVLALTAHAFDEMAVRGLAEGFNEVLTKPIRNTALLEALARHAPPSQSILPTRITVADDLRDVVPGYLERRRAEIAVYRRALDQGDLEMIRMMAHRMKGTGAGYGFVRLTELGGILEQAARSKDAAEVRLRLDHLSRYLDSVELEYN